MTYVSPRKEVLDGATACVLGDRNANYGDPNQDFKRTAALWNIYLHGVAERKLADDEWDVGTREAALGIVHRLIDTWDVGQMMTLLKISRSTVSPANVDHYIDAAGYQACAWDCAEVHA